MVPSTEGAAHVSRAAILVIILVNKSMKGWIPLTKVDVKNCAATSDRIHHSKAADLRLYTDLFNPDTINSIELDRSENLRLRMARRQPMETLGTAAQHASV